MSAETDDLSEDMTGQAATQALGQIGGGLLEKLLEGRQ
jgi:hypothetical protein